jgi:hypothetical protein
VLGWAVALNVKKLEVLQSLDVDTDGLINL